MNEKELSAENEKYAARAKVMIPLIEQAFSAIYQMEITIKQSSDCNYQISNKQDELGTICENLDYNHFMVTLELGNRCPIEAWPAIEKLSGCQTTLENDSEYYEYHPTTINLRYASQEALQNALPLIAQTVKAVRSITELRHAQVLTDLEALVAEHKKE
ncbi:MAG: hypothetical protein AABY01_00565 [Nanoarchaeota archaeon]